MRRRDRRLRGIPAAAQRRREPQARRRTWREQLVQKTHSEKHAADLVAGLAQGVDCHCSHLPRSKLRGAKKGHKRVHQRLPEAHPETKQRRAGRGERGGVSARGLRKETWRYREDCVASERQARGGVKYVR